MTSTTRPHYPGDHHMISPDTARPGYCSNGACIDVQVTATTVEIRDTKQSISPVLTLDHEGWRRVVGSVHLSTHPRCVAVVGGDYIWVGHDTDGNMHTLAFDNNELAAFVDAVRAGQYRVPAVTR